MALFLMDSALEHPAIDLNASTHDQRALIHIDTSRTAHVDPSLGRSKTR
jgi:hypothetical protein